MPSITVKYANPPSATIQGTNIAIVAVPGSGYRHNDRELASLAFDLDAATSCTVRVSSSSAGSMPAQTCYAGADPTLPLPFIADWNVSSAMVGVLTLTIPAASTVAYPARLQVENGAKVDITVKH